jgi:hypothetical protein
MMASATAHTEMKLIREFAFESEIIISAIAVLG